MEQKHAGAHKQRPEWISHRGYHAEALENTLPAFIEATRRGFTRLETDLRCTADGHIVLVHDRTLARLGGPQRAIDAMTRADVAAINLTGGHQLLFFDEFIERFATCHWIFDIKPESGEQVIAALARWLAVRKAHDWVRTQARFLFWRAAQQKRLTAVLPGAHFLARREECWQAGLAILAKRPALGAIKPGHSYALPPQIGTLALYRPAVVEAYHRCGARVIAFLPRPGAQVQAAIAAGVDEILTDFDQEV